MSKTLRSKVRQIIEAVDYTEDDVTADRLWGMFERQSRIKSYRECVKMLEAMKRDGISVDDMLTSRRDSLKSYEQIGEEVDKTSEGI